MSTPALLKRTRIFTNARVQCGAGHVTRADVFFAAYQRKDMDGEALEPFQATEYEPETCVVCGTRIVKREPESLAKVSIAPGPEKE